MTRAGIAAALGVVCLVAIGGCGSDPTELDAGGEPGTALSAEEREAVVRAELQCATGEHLSEIEVHRIPMPTNVTGDESVRTAEAAANRHLAAAARDGQAEQLGPRNHAVRDGVVLLDNTERSSYLVRFVDGEKKFQYLFGEEVEDVWIFLGGAACVPGDDRARA